MKPPLASHPDNHASMSAQDRGRRSLPTDHDRARWLELADAALRWAPSEKDIAKTEALARKEQEAIQRDVSAALLRRSRDRASPRIRT